MSTVFLRSLHEDQPVLLQFGGAVELALGRGDSLGVLASVVLSEQAHVDVAPLNLLQIDPIWALIGSRHFLEQKNLEETPHERVTAQVVADAFPLPCEFALHAADEDADRGHWLGSSTISLVPLSATISAKLPPSGTSMSA